MDLNERIFILYADAQYELDKLHQPFIEDNYKWEIGVHVYNELNNRMYVFYCYSKDIERVPLLYGIEVEINLKNPDALNLWRRIDG